MLPRPAVEVVEEVYVKGTLCREAEGGIDGRDCMLEAKASLFRGGLLGVNICGFITPPLVVGVLLWVSGVLG